MKKQEKSPGCGGRGGGSKEMEISNMPDKEFKEWLKKMLTNSESGKWGECQQTVWKRKRELRGPEGY